MSATDELRRLLDERGVEWGNVRNDGSESDYLTEWQFDGIQSYAVATEWAVGGGLSLEIHRHHLTPEQAIEATLGRTCRWEYPQGVNGWVGYMVCSCCGAKYDETVTDEANYCPNCGAKVVER